MKRFVGFAVFAIFSVAGSSYAQSTSDESLPNSTLSVESSEAGTGQTVSTAESLSPVTEASTKKIQLNLSSESWVLAKDQNENGRNAQLTSLNAVGLIYNLNKKTQFELRQYVEYASQIDTLSGSAKQLHQNEWEMSRTVLRVYGKLFSIFNSKPISVEGRYYAPNDRVAQENKDNGILRTDITSTWDLNPKVTIGAYLRGVIQLNSSNNPNVAKGSDAEYYRLIASPSAAYNFSDKISSYYAFYVDEMAGEAQRGNFNNDLANDAWHEAGLLWTLGPVLINPAIVSVLNQNNGDASLFTKDGRYFANENTLYYLNLYATF